MRNHYLTMLDFTITTSICDIPKEAWDELFGDKIIEGYGYHKALEESSLTEFRLYYLIGKRDNSIVAIIPFFTMNFSFTTLVRGTLQNFIVMVRKIYKNFLKMKLLFIGAPATEYLYIGIRANEKIDEIFDVALAKLTNFCKNQKISSLVFYNLTPLHKELAEYLQRKKFMQMKNFPNARIKITGENSDEYINSLGKSTRKDIRRKLKKSLQAPMLTTELYDNIEVIIGDIYKLYINNFNESDVHFEFLTPQFFINLCRYMPGVIKCFVTRAEDKIVAFNLCMVNNDLCIDKFLGMDYEVAYKYNLYYTTFYHNIGWCIKKGIKFYQPGQGDYDAKIRLGAKLIPLDIYIRAFHPLLKLFLKIIIRIVEPKNFDPALKNIKKYNNSEKEISADFDFLSGSKVN